MPLQTSTIIVSHRNNNSLRGGRSESHDCTETFYIHKFNSPEWYLTMAPLPLKGLPIANWGIDHDPHFCMNFRWFEAITSSLLWSWSGLARQLRVNLLTFTMTAVILTSHRPVRRAGCFIFCSVTSWQQIRGLHHLDFYNYIDLPSPLPPSSSSFPLSSLHPGFKVSPMDRTLKFC